MNDPFDKKNLSETDIRDKFITPAIVRAGWNLYTQILAEYPITNGRIVAHGKTCKRKKPLKADYVLFYKTNKPIAIVEAKDNEEPVGGGMQQALDYARMMDIPFVFSSNGDGFVFHNKYITQGDAEVTLSLDHFPRRKSCGNCIVNRITSTLLRRESSMNRTILTTLTNSRVIIR